MPPRPFLAAALVLALAVCGAPAPAAAGFLDQFEDSEDGWFDYSDWLMDNAYGFMPVPIIITEPAVDNGLGLAGMFIHAKPGAWRDESGNFTRASTSGVAGAYTGNDSWFVGAGHVGYWKKDHLRYLGAGGYASMNLTFYGAEISLILDRWCRQDTVYLVDPSKLSFRPLAGRALFTEPLARIGDTHRWQMIMEGTLECLNRNEAHAVHSALT